MQVNNNAIGESLYTACKQAAPDNTPTTVYHIRLSFCDMAKKFS
jgi:hypothetical protein